MVFTERNILDIRIIISHLFAFQPTSQSVHSFAFQPTSQSIQISPQISNAVEPHVVLPKLEDMEIEETDPVSSIDLALK